MNATEVIHSNSELDLWLRCAAQGDRDALDRLYHAAAPAVYAYALSILKNTHDAEDVLQDCFLTVSGGVGSYQSKGKPMAWLMTVTRNLCFKQLRSQSRHLSLFPEQSFTLVQDPEDRLILESCLTQLRDDERQIVVLHVVAGFRFREVSAHLGMKLPTVLTVYRRAIQKLKKIL